MNATLPPMVLLLVLTACAPTAETFPKQLGTQFCTRWEECYRADYQSRFDDRADCVDEVQSQVEDAFDGCAFDQKKATDCLQEISTDDCDDVADDYTHCLLGNTVYTCDWTY